jgi:hypothetical protein
MFDFQSGGEDMKTPILAFFFASALIVSLPSGSQGQESTGFVACSECHVCPWDSDAWYLSSTGVSIIQVAGPQGYCGPTCGDLGTICSDGFDESLVQIVQRTGSGHDLDPAADATVWEDLDAGSVEIVADGEFVYLRSTCDPERVVALPLF